MTGVRESARRVASLAMLTFLILIAWPRGASAAEELAVEIVGHDTPQTMCPGEGRPVRVQLRNTGTQTWSTQRGDRVSYRWLDAMGEPVRGGRRTELPKDVAPGATVELPAILEAPSAAGVYRLQWGIVRERVGWAASSVELARVDVNADDRAALAWTIEAGWEDTASLASAELGANGSTEVELTLRNVGCATWSAADGDAVSYHWLSPSGDTIVWDGVRTPLPEVAPGERVSVRARVVAPPTPGAHRLVWEPVREHVRWYGSATGGRHEREVEIGPPALGWSLVHGGRPPALHADQSVTVELGVRNDGTLPWSHEAGDRLSYRWSRIDAAPSESIEGMRTILEQPVAPGETAVLQARLRAPTDPGQYRLAWQPVREGVAWYGPPVDPEPPATFDIEVGRPLLAWALERRAEPRVLWAARDEAMRVVVRNEGAAIWSPEAGDRMSYRWIDDDGEIVVRDGLRTPLPGPVAPGESVVLDVRVRGLATPGRYTLVLEMVREHVAWYGDPVRGRAELRLRVMRGSSALGLGLLALACGLVVVRIRGLGRPRTRVVLGSASLPVVLALAVFVLSETFFDHAGIEPWSGARWWALSGALGWGLALGLLPTRARPWVGVATLALLSVLCLADLAYVHFFGSIVPLGALMAAHQLGDATGTVSSLLEPEYLWFLPPLLAVVVVATRGPAPMRDAPTRVHRIVLACLALGTLPAAVQLGQATFGSLGTRVFSETQNVGRFGVVNAHVFQLGRALRGLGGRSRLTEADRAEVAAFFAERSDVSAPSAHFGSARGSNLIVLQVEALQDWVVDAQVVGGPVMPFLSSATSQAARLTQVFDQTAQGRTSDAEYLVLASGHPLAEGALCFLRAESNFHTWAHALREHGYSTISAHPYKRGFWNRATIHPRYGFATSLFRRELGDGPVVGWGLADGPFLERMAERLDAQSEPFAAFLVTLSLHHPYESFPESLQSLDMGELQGTQLGNFLHAMHYFDRALESFVEDLRRRGLLDRTVLLVFGDHVAQLEETPQMLAHSGVDAWSPATPTRSRRVAAFVWGPGLEGTIDRVGGQIDLGATALHLLGVPAPPAFIGRPLVERGPGFAALAGGSAVSDDRMYVVSGRDIGREGACFDHPSGGSRPLADCRALAEQAARELAVSRRVLDHDLFRVLPAE